MSVVKKKVGNYELKDVKLMCNKQKLENLMDTKNTKLKEIQRLEAKISDRKTLFEWLEDAIAKDKESVEDYHSYQDINDTEEADLMFGDLFQTKRIQIGKTLKKLNEKFEACNDIKKKIKEF